MRARNLKPQFFKNERIAQCSFGARLCYEGLWCLSDKNGVLEDRPRTIKAEVFPHDPHDAAPVDAFLGELAAAELIVRYRAAGRALIFIAGWDEHGRPHPKEPERFPRPEAVPASEQNTAEPQQAVTSHEKTCPVALNAESGILTSESLTSENGRAAAPVSQNPKFTTDGPLDPKHWPPFLTTEWVTRFTGTQHSERDHGRLNKFFAGLIDEGRDPKQILAKIREPPRPKRQATWDFLDWCGWNRKEKTNGRPSKRGH